MFAADFFFLLFFFLLYKFNIYVEFVQGGFNWTLCQRCMFVHFVHFLLLQNADCTYEHGLKVAASLKK